MITGMPRIAIAVHNFDDALAVFGDKLGMPVIDLSDSSVRGLGARLAMCVPAGGSNIEIMCPADPGLPLSQSLERFLARRGEGLFALMLEAPDPDAEAERLLAAGLDVLPLMAGAGGRDIHPKSTHGVLIRIYPTGSFQGQRTQGDDALVLSGIMRVVIAVRDLDAAVAVYGDQLGLPVDSPAIDAERGVGFATVRPAAGGVVELVSVGDESRPFAASVQAFLRERGEGLFALVLQSRDPEKAAAIIAQRGLTASRGEGGIALLPAETFGAHILIEGAERV